MLQLHGFAAGAWLLVAMFTFVTATATNQTINGQSFPKMINVTTEDLDRGLAQGLFTSVDLVKVYLARIMEVNSTLHMVTEVNPDALSIARSLDAERAAGHVRGPLHGIPILIKNNIATADKMSNTAGSFSLLGARVPRDSTVAAKLRKAGAIILGKTNLSQWANFRSDNTSNGWSAYGGQTYGVYYPKEDPSGSSSGSAVSSAIGLALSCLGTETDGSIISPSEFAALAGIKPTVGLTSRYLVIPISQHQDTVGTLTRTVKDGAYLLQAIAGPDPRDNYTSAIPPGPLPDYVKACNPNALKGVRLGVPRNAVEAFSTNTTGAIVNAFNAAIKTLEKAGATVVQSNFTGLDAFLKSGSEFKVLEADFISDLYTYLSELIYNPQKVTDLSQVAQFTKNFPPEQYPRRDINIWTDALQQGYNNTSPQFWKQYQEDLKLGGVDTLYGALKNFKLDAVILPTAFASTFGALTGSPIVTVPLGFSPDDTPITMNEFGNLIATGPRIPFGLSFLGPHFSEASLIGYAYAYEQITQTRNKVPPYIIPNIELENVVGNKSMH